MQPEIKVLVEKKLVGIKITMSLASNKTFELWRSFMPNKKNILNCLSNQLFSIQVYNSAFNFNTFSVDAEFEKWAVVEVEDFSNVPNNMETFILGTGLYAVFYYKGLSTDTKIFEYIHATWLPNSIYLLDQRPHFEIMDERYKNGDPNSEEEIWIPIKPKNNT